MTYSVDALKKMRREAKSKRKEFSNRMDAVRKPHENSYKMDDYYLKIRKKIEKCTSELTNGIVGMSSVLDGKSSSITSNGESQSLSSQYQFSQALSNMELEIGRCKENVNYYNGKIAEYERQIKEQGGVILPWE